MASSLGANPIWIRLIDNVGPVLCPQYGAYIHSLHYQVNLKSKKVYFRLTLEISSINYFSENFSMKWNLLKMISLLPSFSFEVLSWHRRLPHFLWPKK